MSVIYLKEDITKVNEYHGYTTKSSQFNFVVPKIKGVYS
jgi:hypothetical protein